MAKLGDSTVFHIQVSQRDLMKGVPSPYYPHTRLKAHYQGLQRLDVESNSTETGGRPIGSKGGRSIVDAKLLDHCRSLTQGTRWLGLGNIPLSRV